VLITRKLLIPQTDKKDETAKKPIPLYVYCTVIFLRTFFAEKCMVLFLAPKADQQQIDDISVCS